MHKSRYFRLVASLLVAFFVAACTPAPAFKSMDISGVEWGGDFTLTAHTGKPVKASDFNGKVVVMFFGYTHCPDVCAPTLVKLDQVVKRLGDEAKNVQVLFITVDPAHDTVQAARGLHSPVQSFLHRPHRHRQGDRGGGGEYKVAYGQNPQSQAGADSGGPFHGDSGEGQKGEAAVAGEK